MALDRKRRRRPLLESASGSRAAAMLLAAAALAGCDWVMRIDADVRVLPAAMSAVGPYPQQLLLGHEDPDRPDGYGAYRLAVLCAPAEEPFETSWRLVVVNGCGNTGDLTAWLAPAEPQLSCGARPVEGDFLGSAPRPVQGEPFAISVVFAGGGHCPRRDHVALRIGALSGP